MSSSIDIRLAKAMAHPVRARALQILNERIASPSDIAKELELPVANVSYHVNTLLRLQCIEEVDTHVVRGAIEHMYRALRRPLAELEDVAAMPDNVRNALCVEVYNDAVAEARAALAAGTAERRPDVYWSTNKGLLDDEAFRNVHDILRSAFAAIESEREAARERLASGETQPVEWRLTLLHYEGAGAAAEPAA